MDKSGTAADHNEGFFKLFLRFLRFGSLAWGGPVAQINMIREELVEREGWITPEKFKRALAVYQALPGPEAHELCVYFGMLRGGRLGGFLAGLGFMLPGFLLILGLALAYQKLGPDVVLPLFAGVAPAVAALILRALIRLGQHTLHSKTLFAVAALSAALSLAGVHFLLIFLLCVMGSLLKPRTSLPVLAGIMAVAAAVIVTLSYMIPAAGFNAQEGLLAEGLKAGLLSFGGAYTAIPFLKASMVGQYPNITEQSFLDALALSNVIPAPLVIFGTFLGFLAEGLKGALLMTIGIFLPAFSFTLLGHKYLEKVIENPALQDGLNCLAAAVIGLLAVTTAQILQSTLLGVYHLLIFGGALAGLYLLKFKWGVPVIILASGLLGLLLPLATTPY